MTDISTIWVASELGGDWKLEGPSLASGDDLTTSVLISLFTDRVAQAGDTIPDGTRNPRGWWGDNKPDGNTIPIGSRLWLLDREKQTNDVLNRAKTYAQEALQWMISDGVAAAVDVAATWQAPGFLAMVVTIRRRNGTTVALNFKWAWEQI